MLQVIKDQDWSQYVLNFTIVSFSRLSIPSSMMCLRLLSPCRPHTALLCLETMSSSLCTSTSVGKASGGRDKRSCDLSHQACIFLVSRLYPVDRSRVNEYGEAFESDDVKLKEE